MLAPGWILRRSHNESWCSITTKRAFNADGFALVFRRDPYFDGDAVSAACGKFSAIRHARIGWSVIRFDSVNTAKVRCKIDCI